MKWKTRFRKCIYVSPSGYKVFQNWFYRWLTLDSTALQTVICRPIPQKPVLYYVPALSFLAAKLSGHCCILGLGGASVPRLLFSKHPEQQITAVECSLEVIHIAKQFFMLDSIQGLVVVNQNAQDFVRECVEVFDHLIIDLYDAHHFPTECHNEEFFIAAKNRLRTNGYLSINLANYKEQWPIYQLIKKHFKNTLIIPVKKSANVVIIASDKGSQEDFLNQIETCHSFKKMTWMDKWGFVAEY